MRMRVFAVVLFFFILATTARAQTVLIQRYDAAFENGQHSALCVVPLIVKESGVRYICYYLIPGQPKKRDNTTPGGEPKPIAEAADPYFNAWLNNRLPKGATCNLAAIAASPGLPPQEDLSCPGAKYASPTLSSGASATFIDDVRKAVDGALPTKTVPPQPTAPPPPMIETGTVSNETDEAQRKAKEAKTAEGAKNAREARQKTEEAKKAEDARKAEAAKIAEQARKDEEAREREGFTFRDGTMVGLLVLITILSVALFLERLFQIVRRHKFLKNALANDEVVRGAATLELAAVMLQRQRDDERRHVASLTATLTEAETALREIDSHLDVAKGGDRIGRAVALAALEKASMRLAGVDSHVAVIPAIEKRLNDHKAIDDVLRGEIGTSSTPEYVRDCVALVKAFSHPFYNTNDPVLARLAVDEVRKDVHRLYASVNPDGANGANEPSARSEIATIEQALGRLQKHSAERQRVIDGQNQNLETVRHFITKEWPDAGPGDFSATIPSLVTRMQTARAAAAKTGCPTGGSADAVVTELAASVERERSASRGAQVMLRRLRDYLSLPDQDAARLSALITAELGKPNRVLRLALAAAIPVLRTNLAVLTAGEEASVIRMLRMAEIADELEAFLGRLGTYNGAELWEKGIQTAFAKSWLHHLFRAEAVLRTYFSASVLADVSDVLTAVAWAFRHATTAAGYSIDRVQLLSVPSNGLLPLHDSPLEFRSCRDIRTRVQAVLKNQRDGGFAVDIDSIGIREGDNVFERGTVVLAKRIDWED